MLLVPKGLESTLNIALDELCYGANYSAIHQELTNAFNLEFFDDFMVSNIWVFKQWILTLVKRVLARCINVMRLLAMGSGFLSLYISYILIISHIEL